jgi:hypothetical protein
MKREREGKIWLKNGHKLPKKGPKKLKFGP